MSILKLCACSMVTKALPIRSLPPNSGGGSELAQPITEPSSRESPSKREVYVGVVGVTGSGKSTLIQNLTGDGNITTGKTLHSMTQSVQLASLELNGTTIHLVDTPGFNDGVRDDQDVCDELAKWFKETHEQGREFSGLLYLHPMNNTRMTGSAVQSLEIFRRLVGSANYERVVIGMTFLDTEEPAVVAAREAEMRNDPEFWGDLIEAGARVIRIEQPEMTECKAVLAEFAGLSGVTLQIEDELCNQGKSAAETEAMAATSHAQDLRLLNLPEEWELNAQERVYQERARLRAEFETDRTNLEGRILDERRGKLIAEEDALSWRARFEEESRHRRNQTSLYDSTLEAFQHERNRWELEMEREKEQWELERNDWEQEVLDKELVIKELMAKELMAKELMANELRKERDAKEKHEKLQQARSLMEGEVRKRHADLQAKGIAYNQYKLFGIPRQTAVVTASNQGSTFVSPSRCDLCLRIMTNRDPACVFEVLPSRLPLDFGPNANTCTSCFKVADEYFLSERWSPVWLFPCQQEARPCRLEDGMQRYCTMPGCGNALIGLFLHCCRCDCRVNLCSECFFLHGRTCGIPLAHELRVTLRPDSKFAPVIAAVHRSRIGQ